MYIISMYILHTYYIFREQTESKLFDMMGDNDLLCAILIKLKSFQNLTDIAHRYQSSELSLHILSKKSYTYVYLMLLLTAKGN